MGSPEDTTDALKADDVLGRILESGFLSASRKLEAFLRFVVREELEGRGHDLNAYAIAVNALDRPASFDPGSDPVVRVFAGRLRNALADYYEGPGRGDPIRIEIPKGTYRPVFISVPGMSFPEGEVATVAAGPKGPAVKRSHVLTLAILVALALAAFPFKHNDRLPDAPERRVVENAGSEISRPVVEIEPFDAAGAEDFRPLMEALRQQLAVDLSQFRSVRVRNLPAEGARDGALDPPDYSLSGRLERSGGSSRIVISVSETATGTETWSETVGVPRSDADFQHILLTAARSIAPRIGGVSGIAQTEAIRRLEQRRDDLGNARTSDYECVVKVYAFGLSQSPIDEQAARQCLAELTSGGSRDSMVWSFLALIRYIDWLRSPDENDQRLANESLAAARKAIQLDPANANAHEFAAMAYAAMGENETARESFERALAFNPSKPDFYVHYGTYVIQRGDWEHGLELVRKGLDLSPSPPGWMYLPLAMDAFRRDDHEESLRVAELILEKGDRRGYLPALAAAIALGDAALAAHYLAEYNKAFPRPEGHPLRDMSRTFRDTELVAKYERTLAGALSY